jgi:hypothetical protein
MSLTVNTNTYAIDATRGDDHLIRFTVRNAGGSVYNVSANSFKFTVKSSLDDVIADAKFQKLSPVGNGIDLGSAASGLVDVLLVPADTAALAGPYYYDLEMTESGKVYTLRQAILTILKDVTTAGTVPTPAIVGSAFPGYVSIVGALYLYGLDLLWHKFQVDANGIWGETAIPQAGAPPF